MVSNHVPYTHKYLCSDNPGRSSTCCSAKKEVASASKLMRNAWQGFFPAKYIIAQLSDVVINISIRVSLQWFKLNRKKSATKTTHNESESVCTVVHEIEAIVIVSQTKIAQKRMASSSA